MKTLYIATIAASLIMPAFAAAQRYERVPSTYTLPYGTEQQPYEETTFSLELSGAYNIAGSDLFRGDDNMVGKVNTWGVDMTGICHFNEHHALTLRLSYAWGDDDATFPEYGERCKDEVSSISIMPGYRYTFHPTRDLSLYLGAAVGYNRLGVKETWWYGDGGDREKNHASGFAYSAEMGINYAFSETVSLFASYQFGGSTAQTKWSEDDFNWKSKRQTYHTFRVGFGFQF